MYLVIRQERMMHDWSQDYVAEQIGVTSETVHYIETGQRKPSYDVLVKLLDLFDKKEAVKEIHELFKETNLPT